ncbi:MAG: hypothetical protein ACPG8W_19530 [Candidatus Promineifilaceae bacterium]
MKQFLTNLLLISALMSVSIYLGAFATRYAGTDPYAEYAQQFAQFRQLQAAPDAISLGNSFAGALDFETLELNGYHLWLSGGDLFEANYILSEALATHSPPQTVFLNLSYFAFHHDNAATETTHQRRKWLYNATNRWQIIEGDRSAFITGRLNRYLPGDTVLSTAKVPLLRTLLGLQAPVAKHPLYHPDGQPVHDRYQQCASNSYEGHAEHSERVATRQALFLQEMAQDRPNIQLGTRSALEQSIQIAQAQRVTLVLYIPPFFEAYNEVYDFDGKQSALRLIEQLSAASGVHFYDFSAETTLSNNPTLFFDPIHLNQCGARRFSQLLAAQLRADGIISAEQTTP